ncbi:unnamed protein product [Chrysoparadoxa australica]
MSLDYAGGEVLPLKKKTCDFCTRRKRKCDGQEGIKRCSNCQEAGLQCVFSVKQKTGRKRSRLQGEEGTHSMSLLANTQGERVAPERFTVTAGLAVGMVGLQENYFLAAFMRDFNAMISCTTPATVMRGMRGVISPNGSSLERPNVAVFWGAVAMGSKISNAPEHVCDHYIALSRNALEGAAGFCPPTLEAHSLLCLLHLMLGRFPEAKRYQLFATTVYQSLQQSETTTAIDAKLDESVAALAQVLSICFLDSGTNEITLPKESHNMFKLMATGVLSEMVEGTLSPKKEAQALHTLTISMGPISSGWSDRKQSQQCKQEMLKLLERIWQTCKHILAGNDKLSNCPLALIPAKFNEGLMCTLSHDDTKAVKATQEGIQVLHAKLGMVLYPSVYHSIHMAVINCLGLLQHDLYAEIRHLYNLRLFSGHKPLPMQMDQLTAQGLCPSRHCQEAFALVMESRFGNVSPQQQLPQPQHQHQQPHHHHHFHHHHHLHHHYHYQDSVKRVKLVVPMAPMASVVKHIHGIDDVLGPVLGPMPSTYFSMAVGPGSLPTSLPSSRFATVGAAFGGSNKDDLRLNDFDVVPQIEAVSSPLPGTGSGLLDPLDTFC